ncbi:hypothetical protein [Parasphingorhabdus sp.]|uniref:hypothetical protein n=1 Tax=Parasphingorhabdus sp. TaxID=2709688 RepID=UPI003A93199A
MKLIISLKHSAVSDSIHALNRVEFRDETARMDNHLTNHSRHRQAVDKWRIIARDCHLAVSRDLLGRFGVGQRWWIGSAGSQVVK